MCTIMDLISKEDLNNLISGRLRLRELPKNSLEFSTKILTPLVKSSSSKTVISISNSCKLPTETVESHLNNLEAKEIVISSFHKNFRNRKRSRHKKYFSISDSFKVEIKEALDALKKINQINF